MMPYDRNDPRDERLDVVAERDGRAANEALARSLSTLFSMFGGQVLDHAPRMRDRIARV
jgi:hypothetical protein